MLKPGLPTLPRSAIERERLKMILTKQQIEEMSRRSFEGTYYSGKPIADLLETVKHSHAKEQRARELLEAATEYVRHAPICLNNVRHPCDCGLRELQKQIEEHLK